MARPYSTDTRRATACRPRRNVLIARHRLADVLRQEARLLLRSVRWDSDHPKRVAQNKLPLPQPDGCGLPGLGQEDAAIRSRLGKP